VHVTDVTAGRACFGVWGPNAREILQPLTKASLAHADFPYMSARAIAVGDVPCLAVRVTYVGELGWELYCPSEYGAALWDTLMAAGEGHGLVPCGYRAIDALRLEKGYRAWATDITPDATPDEAGLSFAVKPDKGVDFIGREAVLAQRAAGPPATRLVCLVLDDPRAIGLGSEPVRHPDGEVLGRVTTGGYGFAVAASIAWAWVPAAAADVGTRLEVDIFGEWVGAEVRAEPLYDPDGSRIRS
jgi:4-methylaminobutanoate oxidase (formaldehyde-forming)